MVKSRKIGIIYLPTEWTGGVYYILNFISALNLVEEEKQPYIIIFCNNEEDFSYIKRETHYQFLEKQIIPKEIKYSFFQKVANKFSRWISGKNLIERKFNRSLDLIFPFSYHEYFELIQNKVYWLPDLQDKFFPNFFDEETLIARDNHYKKLASLKGTVVFSSYSALNDFKRFYPEMQFKPFVLHFASVTRIQKLPDEKFLRKKYGLWDSFFYSPNQFWRHKNHKVVIDAVAQLAKQGVRASAAFSGNENDPRSPGYIDELKNYVKFLDLENQISFLGFIDREDVFGLMKISMAVIQPSLFEGWSTVVEDALSVNAFLLLSNLEVNKEQINTNALFFEKNSSEDLADKMKIVMTGDFVRDSFDYGERIINYSNDIISFIESVRR